MARSYVCVDDHLLFAQAFSYLMNELPDFVHSGTYSTCESALEIVLNKPPDFIFTDIQFPGMSGIELIQIFRESHADTKIIAVSMISEPSLILKVFDAGANGYIVKNTDFDELNLAIQTVSANINFISPSLKLAIDEFNANSTFSENETDLVHRLSSREVEIVRLISKGYNNQQIGDILFLSPLTVKTHRANILKKLDLNNAASLIHWATKTGII